MKWSGSLAFASETKDPCAGSWIPTSDQSHTKTKRSLNASRLLIMISLHWFITQMKYSIPNYEVELIYEIY